MKRTILKANLGRPVSRLELVRKFCRGKAVLDVGCVQHDLGNVDTDRWLHGAITKVAASVLGVDYLEKEVCELSARGYRAIVADVTRPIETEERFDVVVVGNLIEHLSNFEGLMSNIQRLLKPGGCALISTANPFFREQYFYTAFKNDIIVNPEHTCWIDPVTLDQLARRFGLATSDVYWVKERWKLEQVILHGDSMSLDMFTGKWSLDGTLSVAERIVAPVLRIAFRMLAPRSLSSRVFAKYGNRTSRLLYLRFIGVLFGAFWALYRLLVVTSPINRHELFVSVLRRA